MFIFPYVKAHSLLCHFSRFGPRLARFWGRDPFLDPPVLSDSACPKAARLLYIGLEGRRDVRTRDGGTEGRRDVGT